MTVPLGLKAEVVQLTNKAIGPAVVTMINKYITIHTICDMIVNLKKQYKYISPDNCWDKRISYPQNGIKVFFIEKEKNNSCLQLKFLLGAILS